MIEYPHTVRVRFYPSLSDASSERVQWAINNFRWHEFTTYIPPGNEYTEYHFVNEADAVLFALRWR